MPEASAARICESCAGTFFPESLADVLSYRSLRHEKMEKPEAWHMTDALHRSLSSYIPNDSAVDADATVKLFDLPRCESELKHAQPSAD